MNAQDALKHFRCQRWKYLFLWAFIIGILCGGIGFLIAAFESSPDSTMKELGQTNGGYQDGDWTKYAVAPIKTMFGSVEWSPDTITAGYMAICGGIGFVTGFLSTIYYQRRRWNSVDFCGQQIGSRFNFRFTTPKKHYTRHSDYFNWKYAIATLVVIVFAMVGFGLKGYYADGSLVGAGLNAGFASLGCIVLTATFWILVRFRVIGSNQDKGANPDYHQLGCACKKNSTAQCTCAFFAGATNAEPEKRTKYQEWLNERYRNSPTEGAVKQCVDCGRRLTQVGTRPNYKCKACGTTKLSNKNDIHEENLRKREKNFLTNPYEYHDIPSPETNDGLGESSGESKFDSGIRWHPFDNQGKPIPSRGLTDTERRLRFAVPIKHLNPRKSS